MQRPIQYCSVCEGVVPSRDACNILVQGNSQDNGRWHGDYIEGALWCDCTEPPTTIEGKLI